MPDPPAADDPLDAPGLGARLRGAASVPSELVRLAVRDPEHAGERMVSFAVDRLDDVTKAWAAAHEPLSEAERHALARQQATATAKIARVDGAIAGTPFFIALVPAYIAYLWQEVRMMLRVAALYGRDPTDPHVAAELLVLRGVRPTVEEAEAAISRVRAEPLPPPPERRRPLRTWYRSVKRILVLAGFLPPDEPRDGPPTVRDRLLSLVKLAVTGVIYLATWVFPVSFMIVMSYGCERDARTMGRRTLEFYGGTEAVEAAVARADARTDSDRSRRETVRTVLLSVSVLGSLGLLALAVIDQRRHIIGLPVGLASIVGLALVLTLAGLAART